MKKTIFVLMALALTGCGERLESYVDNPASIIEDPHFTGYEQKKDALESEYLRHKITYAEYLERKEKLDNTYTKEVKERTDIITDQPAR